MPCPLMDRTCFHLTLYLSKTVYTNLYANNTSIRINLNWFNNINLIWFMHKRRGMFILRQKSKQRSPVYTLSIKITTKPGSQSLPPGNILLNKIWNPSRTFTYTIRAKYARSAELTSNELSSKTQISRG